MKLLKYEHEITGYFHNKPPRNEYQPQRKQPNTSKLEDSFQLDYENEDLLIELDYQKNSIV